MNIKRLVIGTLALVSLVCGASAQNFSRVPLLTAPIRINTASNYTVNSGWIDLPKTGGFGLVTESVSTNASGSNITFTIQFSADKVKPVTTRTALHVPLCNGTTPVTSYTNFGLVDITGHTGNLLASDTAGLNYFRLSAILNGHSASLWVTNVFALVPK